MFRLSPDAGETTAQQYERFALSSEIVLETIKVSFGYVSPANSKAGFAHDVSDAEASFMSASQVPIDTSAFATKLEHAAWRTQPSWAFDQAMPIHMAERINTRITKVSASHAVFMTQPPLSPIPSIRPPRLLPPKQSDDHLHRYLSGKACPIACLPQPASICFWVSFRADGVSRV